jgi:ADP-ribosylglycohydrolase
MTDDHTRDRLDALRRAKPNLHTKSEVENHDHRRAPTPRPCENHVMTNPDQRAQGCLVGQIAGDSLGSLVEFRTTASIRGENPDGVRELANGGTYNTLAGQPTDDSELALALARTLVSEPWFNLGDDAARARVRRAYVAWARSKPFDIGNATSSALLRDAPDPNTQANGALMRVSPLGIFGARDRIDSHDLWSWAWEEAAITHPHRTCREASALYVCATAHAIREGASPRDVYEHVVQLADARQIESEELRAAIDAAASAPPPNYQHQMGWVVTAFHNALYQLLNAPDLEAGVVDTVMRGGDTDTNAAIAGALLGAVHGIDAIPEQWLAKIESCRPEPGRAGVHRPRPREYWPIDARDLAVRLRAERPFPDPPDDVLAAITRLSESDYNDIAAFVERMPATDDETFGEELHQFLYAKRLVTGYGDAVEQAYALVRSPERGVDIDAMDDETAARALSGFVRGARGGDPVYSTAELDVVRRLLRRVLAMASSTRSTAPTTSERARVDPLPARTWWIERDAVLGGPFPGAPTAPEMRAKLEALIDLGVRTFVNLQEPHERGAGGNRFPDYTRIASSLSSEPLAFHRIAIKDMTAARMRDVTSAMHAIRDGLEHGLVYVHCWGGHGRTGTIAGCWLRSTGLTADDALAQIRDARAHDAHLSSMPSPQTPEQRAVIEKWQT